MASAATHLDFHTKGAKKATGGQMRSHQDDQQGGTDANDARIAWERGYGEQLIIRDGKYWDKLVADRELGWFVCVDVWYADLPMRVQQSASFGHTMGIAPETNRAGKWLVSDPLRSDWVWMDPIGIKLAAEEWGRRILSGASGKTHGPGDTGGAVPIRYTTAIEVHMANYTAPANEIGGTLTLKMDAQAIPLEGAIGERLAVAKGITRPAIGVFKLDDLDGVEAYLMLIGSRLAFVKAGAVTFTPNSNADTNAIITQRDAQWIERLTPPR